MGFVRTAAILLVPCVIAFAASGCVSPSGQQRAQVTTTEMGAYSTQAATLHKLVDQTVESLNKIVSERATNPRAHYDAFSKSLVAMEQQMGRTASSAKRMNAKGDAYFQTWDLELGTITNLEIRKRSEARRSEVMAAYAKVDVAQQAQKDTFDKFVANLRDLHKCLRTDLTPLGISAVTDLIEKAGVEAKHVKAKIDTAVKEVEAMRASLNVPAPQPTPANQTKNTETNSK
ncbi:MAG: DUF2959 family protein [Planctomycetes bacterium]|nr:DUF2959 family protein [Planctomycetota bacterium]